MLITDEYCKQNAMLHKQMAAYGKGGSPWMQTVLRLMRKTRAKSVLDYGCGKGGLVQSLRCYWKRRRKISAYDPCIKKFAGLPESVDLVVCTDVLEHIEPECIHDVLMHIQSLAKRAFFAHIVLRESGKFLSDGRNTHILVRSSDWWRDILEQYFPKGTLICPYNRKDRINFTWLR